MKKVLLISMAVLMFIPGFLFAEKITKIAVVDLTKVVQAYNRGKASVKAIETEKVKIQKKELELKNEITELTGKYKEAVAQEDEETSKKLKAQINKKISYLKEYHASKQKELNAMSAKVAKKFKVNKEILSAIKYVAESGSFSMVLTDRTSGLLWWSYDVDITDKVIQRLLTTSKKK